MVSSMREILRGLDRQELMHNMAALKGAAGNIMS